LQEFRAGEHVLIFGGTRRPRMIGMMEFAAVADAEPVIDGKNDETVVGEILIHRIGIAVIVHVVPAEQHLPRRPAVHENDSGFRAGVVVARDQLPVNGHAIGRLE
jgi:hypothetical protein